MTDYKNLKLIATSSPHIRAAENTRSIMLDVIIAMLPALVYAVWAFGLRALTVTCASVIFCMAWEWVYRKLMKKNQAVGDLSAVVTGMLLAFVCPVGVTYFALFVGSFFSIVVAKQLFGGIGKNFVNPALVGRAMMVASFAGNMTTWAKFQATSHLFGSNADTVTAATPMAYLHTNNLQGLLDSGVTMTDMFLGRIGGSIGEISALMLIAGGIYLLARKVISWQTPVGYIATVVVLTLIFPRGNDAITWMLFNLLGGGLLLGAFFMATDYATSPVTPTGQLIYGIGCGLITIFIRYFGSYNEGVCYSILVMNLLTALIDKYVKPQRFGVVKSDKKEAASK
ncbi:RnfABCDGE type electron transport complex subunit D [Oscillibacter sp. GMB15532]|uniref:RnfABCDGE type electron transport complex subunit D n=1 Tax=Oscillibacter sp. GMB15532 TaxID=3230022 RepID=UPI0034DFF146